MSMTTEYGRGTGRYGDFGRYIFESALRTWKVDANGLSNLAVQWIFEKYGYDTRKHGEFDSLIGTGRARATFPHERIGKKYQWLAMYEILARVSDNFTKYESWGHPKEEEPYQGPWQPYVRDIDPTILLSKTGEYDEERNDEFWWAPERYSNWVVENKEWPKIDNDLPNCKKLINVTDENENEWLILKGYPEWAESKKLGDKKWDKLHKRIWYQVDSFLVSNKEFEKVKAWSLKQDYYGIQIPEITNRYEIFYREYYWAPAYQQLNFDGIEHFEINDEKLKKNIGNAILTANRFLWEEEYDKSKEDAISFLKPSKYIYDYMNLKHSNNEGEFLNKNEEIVCFDPSVFNDSKSYLIIKKKPFLEFLRTNDLKIIWTIIGEKQIIGGSWNSNNSHKRLEISGAYYLNDNDEIGGDISTKIT